MSNEIWNSGHTLFRHCISPREVPISLQTWTIKEKGSLQFLAAFEMDVQMSGFPIIAVMLYDDPKNKQLKTSIKRDGRIIRFLSIYFLSRDVVLAHSKCRIELAKTLCHTSFIELMVVMHGEGIYNKGYKVVKEFDNINPYLFLTLPAFILLVGWIRLKK